MRIPSKRDIYFLFEKLSLGYRERQFIYWLIGLIVFSEILFRFNPIQKEQKQYDYTAIDSLVHVRTQRIQAAYDSIIATQYHPIERTEDNKAVAEISPKVSPSKSSIKQEKPIEPIDINVATLDEWIKIPGIGEKTANLILDYRMDNGEFKSIEDLKKVKGIGDKKLEKLRVYLKIVPR